MKKFAIIGRLGLISVIIGWIGCSDLSVSNGSAQNIEGAFGLKLGEIYEKEVDENYAAAFPPPNPVKPFTVHKLVVVPSTKKICFIMALANFKDVDKAKQLHKALMRVIAKKYNAKFREGLSNPLIHEKYVQAAQKVETGEKGRVEIEEQREEIPFENRIRHARGRQPIHYLKKGGRVITINVYFDTATLLLKLRLTYGDENLMRSAIEEEQEKEESKINVEGL